MTAPRRRAVPGGRPGAPRPPPPQCSRPPRAGRSTASSPRSASPSSRSSRSRWPASSGSSSRSFPARALRSPADYAEQMEILRARVEPSLGPGADRPLRGAGLLPRLLRLVVHGAPGAPRRVDRRLHPGPDAAPVALGPRRPRRAAGRVLRPGPAGPGRDRRRASRPTTSGRPSAASRFRVREAEGAGGVRYLYGDRHQNAKLFTLVTHAGLVGFILAAASRAGSASRPGSSCPRARRSRWTSIGYGRPRLGQEPRLHGARATQTGRFTDFTTDLAVYRDGEEIARKMIRVNDPLEAAGYTFHQNFFGPAVDLTIRDGAGRLLWTGPVPLDEVNARAARTAASRSPAARRGSSCCSTRPTARRRSLVDARLPADRDRGRRAALRSRRPSSAAPRPGRTYAAPASDLAITFEEVTAYSGVIVKRDPGAVDRVGQLPAPHRRPRR